MKFHIGQKIQYFYPNPKNSSIPYFRGRIEEIFDTHIIIKNDEHVTLKISIANFDLLRPASELNDNPSQVSENYVG